MTALPDTARHATITTPPGPFTVVVTTDADAATRWRPWRSYAVLHLWALAVPSLFTRVPELPRSA